jgi:perosamine synthetase
MSKSAPADQRPPSSSRIIGPEREIPYWRTAIGEEELSEVIATFGKKKFSTGPITKELEDEIATRLDVPYAVCTTSGTMALVMALMAHGVGPGDEVIVPTRTFIATAHAAKLLGARVVLVDCLSDTPLLDLSEVEKKITSRTRAVMPVHLNGRTADLDGLFEIARKHDLAVIEDAAQGFLSRMPNGGFQGTAGGAGCFSFGMVKLISTGQGGAVVTRNEESYERLCALRDHGVRDVIAHEYLMPGANFKFTDILASIGLWQVRKGPEKASHVNAIYKRYRDAFKELPFIRLAPVNVDGGEVSLWPEALCEERERLMDYLDEHGIQTRKFLPCVHTAPHFDTGERFPNSERFSRTGLNLPGGPSLPMDCVDRTIEVLRAYVPKD